MSTIFPPMFVTKHPIYEIGSRCLILSLHISITYLKTRFANIDRRIVKELRNVKRVCSYNNYHGNAGCRFLF